MVVRVSEGEKAAYRAAAVGGGLSAWVRGVLNAEVELALGQALGAVQGRKKNRVRSRVGVVMAEDAPAKTRAGGRGRRRTRGRGVRASVAAVVAQRAAEEEW
jgi:hypothetical protein